MRSASNANQLLKLMNRLIYLLCKTKCMKSKIYKITFFLLFVILPITVSAQKEQLPIFKGCKNTRSQDKVMECFNQKFAKFFGENFVYPSDAENDNIEGIVYASFTVGRSGKVENIKITKGVHPSIDEEVIRVLNLLPDFIPGTQKGVSVPVSYNIPLNCKIK